MDRRVRKTEDSLRQAFVALVSERGYENTSVEDITKRADVARGTFYTHYADKDALLTSIFQDLVNEMVVRLAAVPVDPMIINSGFFRELYQHADEQPDLYRLCLCASGGTRAAYVRLVADAAKLRFTKRYHMAGTHSRVPVHVMAWGFAGMHTALLGDWLDRGCQESIDYMVAMEAQLVAQASTGVGAWSAAG